jgi:hypothetical protein
MLTEKNEMVFPVNGKKQSFTLGFDPKESDFATVNFYKDKEVISSVKINKNDLLFFMFSILGEDQQSDLLEKWEKYSIPAFSRRIQFTAKKDIKEGETVSLDYLIDVEKLIEEKKLEIKK